MLWTVVGAVAGGVEVVAHHSYERAIVADDERLLDDDIPLDGSGRPAAGVVLRREGEDWLGGRGLDVPTSRLLTFDRAKGEQAFFHDPDGNVVRLSRAEVGAARNDEVAMLAEASGGRFVVPVDGGFDPHWLVREPPAALLTAFTSDRAAAEAERKVEGWALSERGRSAESWQDEFINPYTFIPFPREEDGKSILREVPCGHRRLDPDRLHGTVIVQWRTLSPLLTRGVQAGDRWSFPRDVDGTPIIPGASMKGALRSLHEMLAGGCLRVLDGNAIPVHRDPAVAPQGRRMAMVETVDDDGRPTSLRLCDTDVWLKAEDLADVMGGAENVRTGGSVGVVGSQVTTVGGRRKAPAQALHQLAADEPKWVMLVTDAKARDGRKPYYVAAGRLGEQSATLDEAVWDRYLWEVADADDVRRTRDERDPSQFLPVEFPRGSKTIVGHRRRQSRRFLPRDVIWVEGTGAHITRISLSVLWRTTGAGPVSDRLPSSQIACADPALLCVSCRLFGAGSDEVGGYRGHIRFGDATVVGSTTTEEVTLAGQGSPQLSAGQMYLSHSGTAAQSKDDRPHGHWGSKEDLGHMRPLRGRKAYWHGDPDKALGRPRHRAAEGEGKPQTTEVEVVAKGAELSQRLTFENLTSAELGGFLATLEPGLVLHTTPGFTPDPQLAIRVGGGKGLGLGSVTAEHVEIELHDAGSRYLDRPVPTVSAADAVTAFTDATPTTVTDTWPDLAAVLAVGHVDPARITYPPGTGWEAAGTKKFRAGVDGKFWKRSNGSSLGNGMPTLAEPRDPRQGLPMDGSGT